MAATTAVVVYLPFGATGHILFTGVIFVLSRLDYRNAALVGLPAYFVQVQNAAVQVLIHLRSANRITDALATLHFIGCAFRSGSNINGTLLPVDLRSLRGTVASFLIHAKSSSGANGQAINQACFPGCCMAQRSGTPCRKI